MTIELINNRNHHVNCFRDLAGRYGNAEQLCSSDAWGFCWLVRWNRVTIWGTSFLGRMPFTWLEMMSSQNKRRCEVLGVTGYWILLACSPPPSHPIYLTHFQITGHCYFFSQALLLSLCCSFSFSLSEPVIYLLVPLPCWLIRPFETLIWICLEWGLSICFPDKFPGSRDAEVLGPHFEKHCLDPFSILPEYNSKTAIKNLN